ncbi:MAG TPA: putative DNA modification/repair radical SAM protein, partial [Spirochaetales bacterium]|nr:putative DNA modification/repair radical SAM protein [Spirochaetales bacterium]
METAEKLAILAASARYDASCASSGSTRRGALGAASVGGVCHAWTEDGRCVSLLKVLLSNRCRYDCAYCANRASAEVPRAAFETDELVRIVVSFYRRNYIEGLFLSSGVFAEPDTVMERMNEVARRLRRDEGFGGYIHLKAIPGAGERTLTEAGFLADRLSANIELPTARALASLAPDKDGRAIVGMMRAIDGCILENSDGRHRSGAARRNRVWAPAGQSTQLVVGASPDSDREIVTLAGALYREVRLRRVYYSAYLPVSADPRLPGSPPPLLREHRLYQADWLVRRYGFSTGEILED